MDGFITSASACNRQRLGRRTRTQKTLSSHALTVVLRKVYRMSHLDLLQRSQKRQSWRCRSQLRRHHLQPTPRKTRKRRRLKTQRENEKNQLLQLPARDQVAVDDENRMKRINLECITKFKSFELIPTKISFRRAPTDKFARLKLSEQKLLIQQLFA